MSLPPEQWARATAALTTEAFKRRVYQTRDDERLLAYIEYEKDRPRGTRPERIGIANKRRQQLK